MITYVAMSFILSFLGLELLIGSKIEDNYNHFFDKNNTNSLRGFWCLIVILVHTPETYQNRIQDILGSFAYVGVTFFFMTSAYGLRLSIEKKEKTINSFWVKRLPKLLLPCLVTNAIQILFDAIKDVQINIYRLILINNWVQWLLICYFIFWISYRFVKIHQSIVTCILVIIFSLTVYLCKRWIPGVTWCSEVYGFVWGIILFEFKDSFIFWIRRNWVKKCMLLCALAGIIGVSYLKFKFVVFFGDYLLKILLGLVIIIFLLSMNVRISIGNRINTF